MENKRLLSVGIDIGTSTSQMIFSRLTMENTSGYFSVPSVSIVDKEVIYQSPVYTTPLIDTSLIDGKALSQIIEKEYEAAGVKMEQVQTGAVIITGESARKENAAMVLENMSHFAGEFVVSTAGPDLESVIAGQGSGAQQFSEENGAVVVNLDIGGGTTNAVLFDGGKVCGKGCVDIGGRQVTVDKSGRISYISPSARKIAKAYNLSLNLGDTVSETVLEKLCGGMSEMLEQLLGITEKVSLLEEIKTAGSQEFHILKERPIRFICFSGGVADCIYQTGKEKFAYGDIGVILGESIRRSRLFQAFKVIQGGQTIRATVIGAGSYTTTISGSTISYSQGLFPMKNVPVLKLSLEEEDRCWNGDEEFLYQKAKWFLEQGDTEQMVLAIEGKNNPDYERLKKLAVTLTGAMHRVLPEKSPLILIVTEDIAKALGQIMRQMIE
uniref:ethanolamine ammonia-lyase reactivating factor EutA n=1 Tax=uncultured Haemophilus sp. TaxID=237779 RepID=UPI0025E29B5D